MDAQPKPIDAVKIMMDIIDVDAQIIGEILPEDALRSDALQEALTHREALLAILHAMAPAP